jgi:hypothetical protein
MEKRGAVVVEEECCEGVLEGGWGDRRVGEEFGEGREGGWGDGDLAVCKCGVATAQARQDHCCGGVSERGEVGKVGSKGGEVGCGGDEVGAAEPKPALS